MIKKSNLPLYKPPFSRDLTDLGASGVPNAICTIGSAVSIGNCSPVGFEPETGDSWCKTGNSAGYKCGKGNSPGQI